MAPAFRERKDAIAFVSFLVILFALPLLLSVVRKPSREQVWKGVPTAMGPVGDLVATLYEDKGDSDVVLLGTSPLRAAFLPGEVEGYFTQRLGRPARIKTLAMWWQSLDLQYVMLSEYLQTHRTKLVVLEIPAKLSSTSSPHRQLFRWLRHGDAVSAFADLPLRDRATIYAEQVLGAPRQALNLVRPNRLGPHERSAEATEESSSRFRKAGFEGGAFVPMHVDVGPALTQKALTTVTSPRLVREGEAGAYITTFLKKIVVLAKSKGVRLALIHFPELAEAGRSDVPVIFPLSEIFAPDTPVISIPLGDLLFGVPDSEAPRFFFDDHHLNENGARAFGEATLPAIYKAYEQAD